MIRFKPYLFLAVLTLGLFSFLFITTAKASATAVGGTCYFSGATNCTTYDPISWSNDVLSGRPGSNAIPASAYPGTPGNPGAATYTNGATAKTNFINFIKNRLDNGSTQDKVGAALIINKIIQSPAGSRDKSITSTSADGMFVEFKNRINQPAVSIGYDTADIPKTTFYDVNKQDDFFGDYSATNRDVVQLTYNGDVRVTIEIACGNYAGGIGLPPPTNAYAALDGVKISNDGLGYFGGSTNGSYYNDSIAFGAFNPTTENPFYYAGINPGNRTMTITDDPDDWDVLGYSICEAGPGCTSDWMKNNVTPGKTFTFNFEAGKTYHMRWINADSDRPATVSAAYTCSTISGSASDPDRSGGIRVVINIGGTDVYDNTVNGDYSYSVPATYQNTSAKAVTVTAYGQKRSGAAGGTVTATGSFGPCYSAACDGQTASVTYIRANFDSFTATGQFRNNGQLAWNGRMTATATYNGVTSTPSVSGTAVNVTATPTFGTFRSPAGDYGTQTVTMKLRFDNADYISCTYTFIPWTEYVLAANAQNLYLEPKWEDPTQANFTSEVTATFTQLPGAPISFTNPAITATRTITKNGGAFYSASDSGPFAKSYTNDKPAIVNPALGDYYCANITVNQTTGWVRGDGGSVIYIGGPASSSSMPASPAPCNPGGCTSACPSVTNQPYTRAYGGDVVAGGTFLKPDGTCPTPSPGSGKLKANSSFAVGKGGSGTDLAAQAYDIINSFASASRRLSSPVGEGGLTFANNPGLGNFAAASCVTNYFDDTQFQAGDPGMTPPRTTPAAINVNPGQTPTNQQTVFTGGGLVTVKGLPSSRDVRHTIYVDGDAVITDDIALNDDLGGNMTATPYFTLIVRGNIYVSEAVRRLDGLYIAQPKLDGTKGSIYTCRQANGARILSTTMATACDSQLVVNGAFIAQHLYLQRTHGSLRYGAAREGPSDPTSANIAEIFNATPEFFLGRPVFRVQSTTYDSIKALPPVF